VEVIGDFEAKHLSLSLNEGPSTNLSCEGLFHAIKEEIGSVFSDEIYSLWAAVGAWVEQAGAWSTVLSGVWRKIRTKPKKNGNDYHRRGEFKDMCGSNKQASGLLHHKKKKGFNG